MAVKKKKTGWKNLKEDSLEFFNFKLPDTFLDNFCLVVDSREKTPLFLGKKPLKGLTIVRNTLQCGDYSALGFEESVTIERKSMSDFWNCVGVDRDRFTKQLYKLSNLDKKWLLIEGSETEVYNPQLMGRRVHPNSVRGSIVAIEVKFGIPVYYSISKKHSEMFILDRLKQYVQIKREGEK